MIISKTNCPGQGDIRSLGVGDTLFIRSDARERKDWSRISDAIRQAVSRGCGVTWL